MLAVDTNVLLRLVLNDDATQAKLAKDFLTRCQHSGDRLYLSQVVILEFVWVLEAVKEVPREAVLRVLDGILTMPILEVEEPARVARALRLYEEHAVDFTDALLAAMTAEKDMDGVLSFDKDLGKLGAPSIRP